MPRLAKASHTGHRSWTSRDGAAQPARRLPRGSKGARRSDGTTIGDPCRGRGEGGHRNHAASWQRRPSRANASCGKWTRRAILGEGHVCELRVPVCGHGAVHRCVVYWFAREARCSLESRRTPAKSRSLRTRGHLSAQVSLHAAHCSNQTAESTARCVALAPVACSHVCWHTDQCSADGALVRCGAKAGDARLGVP